MGTQGVGSVAMISARLMALTARLLFYVFVGGDISIFTSADDTGITTAGDHMFTNLFMAPFVRTSAQGIACMA